MGRGSLLADAQRPPKNNPQAEDLVVEAHMEVWIEEQGSSDEMKLYDEQTKGCVACILCEWIQLQVHTEQQL